MPQRLCEVCACCFSRRRTVRWDPADMEASGALLPLQAVAVEARCLSDDGVEHTHVELDTLVDVDNSSRRAPRTPHPHTTPPDHNHG